MRARLCVWWAPNSLTSFKRRRNPSMSSANRDACQITITEIRGELGVKQSEIGTLQKVAAEDDQIKTTLRQEAELASKHLLGVEAELRGAHESQQRLQQMLEDERRAWKAKVEAEAQARHDAETHAAEKESDASQVMVLKTELAKKEEALRRMEQDKVHFMGNLDKTMAELDLLPGCSLVLSRPTSSPSPSRSSRAGRKRGTHTMQSTGMYATRDGKKGELVDGGGGTVYEQTTESESEDED